MTAKPYRYRLSSKSPAISINITLIYINKILRVHTGLGYRPCLMVTWYIILFQYINSTPQQVYRIKQRTPF